MSTVSTTTSLEQRVALLEDLEAIRRLKTLYGEYWDGGWPGTRGSGERLAQLFVEDGTWDARPIVPHVLEGRAQIAAACDGMLTANATDASGAQRERAGLSWHLAANPRIDVDGDEAVGTFTGLIASSEADDGRALWCAGRYTDRFVRTDDGWRFRSVAYEYAFYTPYDGPGWILERLREGAA